MISLCLVVHNEARRLPALLESVRGVVSECVVCDNASTDGSGALVAAWARAAGIPVKSMAEADVRGYPDWIYNRVLAQATKPYTLLLDGDETLTPFGREALQDLIACERVDAWSIPRLTIVEGPQPCYHFEWHFRFGRTGAFGYPEGDQGPHQPPRPWPEKAGARHETSQPMLSHIRPEREQYLRDAARGQFDPALAPKPWENVQGWFDYERAVDHIIDRTPEGGHVVEVGVWLGKSTIYWAEKARPKGITVWAVDHFRGTPGEAPHAEYLATGANLYAQCMRNLDAAGALDVVRVLPVGSYQASELFGNVIPDTDAVWLDAGHDYDSVRQDITHWRWRVRPRGIIGGHDYSTAWPGVMRAVNEAFPEGVDAGISPGSWVKQL